MDTIDKIKEFTVEPLKGKKAVVLKDFYSIGHYRKKRLLQGEIVTITDNSPDSEKRVSVKSSMRYYPIHFVPMDILKIVNNQ